MRPSRRRQRLLTEIEEAICRSDPLLASMLATFGRLTSGEQMPDREQVRTPASRLMTAVHAAATVVTRMISRVALWVRERGRRPQRNTRGIAGMCSLAGSSLGRPVPLRTWPAGTRTDRRAVKPGPTPSMNPKEDIMRRIRRRSPLPPDPAGKEDTLQPSPDPSPLPPGPAGKEDIMRLTPEPEEPGEDSSPAPGNGPAPALSAWRGPAWWASLPSLPPLF